MKKKVVIGGAALALILCGLGAWYLVSSLSLTALRAWAVLSMVLLPVVAVISFVIGRWETRAKLDGLNTGIGVVMQAAQRTADLRATIRGQAPVQIAVLPQPEVTRRRIEGKVVDL